jgi:hypothetical protein
MNGNYFDSKEYQQILDRNQLNFQRHTILEEVGYQSFENEDALLKYMLDPGCYENKEYIKRCIEAIKFCLSMQWIKYLNRNDIEFDQPYFNDDPLQIFATYVENSIGISYEGAIVLNNFELQVDEMYRRRPYEKVVREVYDPNGSIGFQGLYADVVKNKLNERMDSIYWTKKNRDKTVEISYVEPYEVGHWYPRRYIKLDKGYRAEMSWAEVGEQ